MNFAIICEYNPFHYGHLKQISQIRAMHPGASVVSVMSGSFVQRGEAAIVGKYARAEAAVRCGCDLVLELPFPFCCSCGELFASAGVSLIARLGVIDSLCFGCESADFDRLRRIAAALESPEFGRELGLACEKSGAEPFSVLRQKLFERLYGEPFVTAPNDILAVEYLRALARTEHAPAPCPIVREGTVSAAGARRILRGGPGDPAEYLPPPMLEALDGEEMTDMRHLGRPLLWRLRTASPEELEGLADIPRGMGSRLIRAAGEAADYDDLCRRCATKKYTDARIRRMLLYGMLHVRDEQLRPFPRFTVVLAMNRRGQELLREISKTHDESLTVITKPAHLKRLEGEAADQAELHSRAEQLFGLDCAAPLSAAAQWRKTPFRMEKTEGEKENTENG